MLAGASTVACSLALLIDALFTPTLLLTWLLALSAAVSVYLAARPWILGPLAGSGTLSAERMFDSLYRVARALEQAPEQAGRQISGLLREVFDPLEMVHTDKPVSRIRVAEDGATLVVPIPQLPNGGPAGPASTSRGTIVLRYARRGRRLFTHEDQLLAERLIEQLRHAVAYDRAVEQGRSEERARIAQDLHDDIGARLLTLMYQAQNPEIEEYIRHTLQDLKTLTRGLAAGNHRLSHAAAEWKADISQRLGATGCDLRWSFSTDRDILLSVVQWSGLTRVLRELVNNIITHARATQVEIAVHFDRGRLLLTVTDDGCGRHPSAWAHGLGLGGVRKRVKLLGGQVLWSEQGERGICCEVRTPLSSEKG
jgi:signal transduction histidine kinase